MKISASLDEVGPVLLDAPLRFVSSAPGVSFAPVSFALTEAISEAFELRVVVETDVHADELAERVLGSVGQLTFGAGRGRTIRGVVCDVESRGVARDAPHAPSYAELVIRPKLALLELRTQSRIFQDATVATVVDAILTEWGLPRRWALAMAHAGWPYNVQHQETDLAFVRRTLAAEGIYFFFDPAREEAGEGLLDDVPIVFGDASSAYGDAGEEGPGARDLVLRVTHEDQATGGDERAFSFVERRRLAPREVLLREYVPSAANGDPKAAARSDTGADRDAFVAAALRTHYEVRPHAPLGLDAATIALSQLRREARVYQGTCAAARLAPGHLFQIVEHSDGSLDGAYVVTRLVSWGHDPRFRRDGRVEPALQQEMQAMRSVDVFRPARTHRATHHGLDTAVVVGPPGQALSTDELGRVQVQFHWDRERPGVREPSPGAAWLRVAQPWNGVGHGAMFLPRVGSEVLVGYIGGDLNRPVVVGSLANSGSPPPFTLPGDAALSGIVSCGIDGDGHSELVFDDTGGREATRLASQRLLELRATQDLATQVGRDEVIDVAEASRLTVGRDRSETVRGDRVVAVSGNSSFSVTRDAVVDVGGTTRVGVETLALRASQEAALSFDAALRCNAGADVRLDVAGTTVARHASALVVAVGTPEASASYLCHVEGTASMESSEVLHLESAKSIVLRCGESTIAITPDAVQISARKLRVDAGDVELVAESAIHLRASDLVRLDAEKIFALARGSSLGLTDNARLDGAEVQLAMPPDATEGPEARKSPTPPTRVTVLDDAGAPVVGEPVLVRSSDGTTRAAVTDGDGVATIRDLEGSGDVDLIDLSQWERG